MSKPYFLYKKTTQQTKKRLMRVLATVLSGTGLVIVSYVLFPLLSWQVYFAPVFASQDVVSPISQAVMLDGKGMHSLLSSGLSDLAGVDYDNIENWFPGYRMTKTNASDITSYTLSIPKLKIVNAMVTTKDNDLNIHLVNISGTAIPPHKGNAVIYGHSTLPQLFDPSNYKTIFANAYKLEEEDTLIVTVSGVQYTYKIVSIKVVASDETSFFVQDPDGSFLTLVTCTPPGTTWKRLIIKSQLMDISQ